MSQRRVPSAPVLAIVAILVCAGGYLAWLSSDLWFLLDDWASLLDRKVTLAGDESLLRPHNDHWVDLPILVFRLLFTSSGMHLLLPYAMVTIRPAPGGLRPTGADALAGRRPPVGGGADDGIVPFSARGA